MNPKKLAIITTVAGLILFVSALIIGITGTNDIPALALLMIGAAIICVGASKWEILSKENRNEP